MALCIPEKTAEKLKKLLRSGEVSVDELAGFNSKKRREFFERYSTPDVAKKINIDFERRMTAKTRKSLDNFIDGLNTPKDVRNTVKSRLADTDNVFTNDGVFLEDLAGQKVGFKLDESEFNLLYDLGKEMEELKAANKKKGISKELKIKNEKKSALLERYLNKEAGAIERSRIGTKAGPRKISQAADEYGKMSIQYRNELGKFMIKAVGEAAGSMKSIKASFDNSLWGRQAIKLLMNVQVGTKNPFITQKIWWNNFKKSWGDFKNTFFSEAYKNRIFKELDLDKDGRVAKYIAKYENELALDMAYSDIYTRPNYKNGKYTRAINNYGLQVREEAFPSSMPERIPYLGKGFKASENAFTAGSARIRADLADVLIDKMEEAGVDMMVKENADALGKLVGGMTGRAHLETFEPVAEFLNKAMFSPRFFKSQLETFTNLKGVAYMGKGATELQKVKKEAAVQSLQQIATAFSLLSIASIFDLTDLDPRSTRFGRIQVKDEILVDITGGNAMVAGMVAKMLSDKRYDPKLGVYKKIDGFGSKSTDILVNFLENKQAPALRIMTDLLNGEHFGGEPISVKNTSKQILLPISVEEISTQFAQRNDISTALIMLMGEAIGMSTVDIRWAPRGKDWSELRKKNEVLFWKASGELSEELQIRMKPLRENEAFQNQENEEKLKRLEKIAREVRKNIISRYKNIEN